MATKKSTRVHLKMLQNPLSKLAAWSKSHKDVLAASYFEGDFRLHFISFPDFFMTEYASLSKYLSKNVQIVIQVVNNKKVMAKTPREANLYGNWCVREGLTNQAKSCRTTTKDRTRTWGFIPQFHGSRPYQHACIHSTKECQISWPLTLPTKNSAIFSRPSRAGLKTDKVIVYFHNSFFL